MGYSRKEIVDQETIITKELLDHLQEALERVFSISNVKTYSSLEQIGIPIGGETVLSIVQKLPDNSELLIPISSGNNKSAFPHTSGNLLVEHTKSNCGKARFWTIISDKPRIWRGVVHNGVWSGWVEDYNEQNPPPASVIEGVALSANHNIKTYTSLAQIGLSNSDLSSSSFDQNIFKVSQKIPDYGQLNLTDTSGYFVSTLISRINSNCETSYTTSDIKLISITKMGVSARAVIEVAIESGISSIIYGALSSANSVSTFTETYNSFGFLTKKSAQDTYLSKSDASKTYLTSSSLSDYVKSDAIKNFITADAIKNFITADAIKNFITSNEIKNFITKTTADQTYAVKSEQNMKTYTSIEQLGLSAVNDMGATFSTNISKIMGKLPSGSQLVFRDLDSKFTSSLASTLNSDLGGTRFGGYSSFLVNLVKHGYYGGVLTVACIGMSPVPICIAGIGTDGTPSTFVELNYGGYVSSDGGVTKGTTFKFNNGLGQSYTNDYQQLLEHTPSKDDSNKTSIGVSHTFDIKDALFLRRTLNNTSTSYSIFGTHNRPQGTYKGNGSASVRTIDIGGNPYAVLIISTGYAVILTQYGGFCVKASNTTGSTVTVLNYWDAMLIPESGHIELNTANDVVNKSGVTYSYYTFV